MSDLARDIVRYIKRVENIQDGHIPSGRVVRPWAHQGNYWEMWQEDRDLAHARMIDYLNPVDNAISAMRYIKDRYSTAWKSYQ
jgi:hypothetical protein